MKKFNIYYLFDGLLALEVTFFLLSRKNIANLYIAGTLVIITVILVFIEAFDKTQLTQTVITNNSDNVVKVKPETDSELVDVEPGQTHVGADGVSVNGTAYKFCSGTHVVVNNDSSISTKAITGKIANFVRGGKLKSAPDEAWVPLINA